MDGWIFNSMQERTTFDTATSLEFHRRHPDISIDQYVKAKSLELAESIHGLDKIYLDQRFWVLLRDAHMGRSKNQAAYALLGMIRSAVANGKVLCPISESVFLELLKQQDLTTRQATAELIDEFSHGITLVPYAQRVAQELISVIVLSSPNGEQYYEPKDLVWSKLSYVLGVVHPFETTFPSEEETAIQKSFFDHMWQIPLVEMLSYLDDTFFTPDKFGETAGKLNELNRNHQNEVKTFKQIYLDEIRGVLSLFMHVPRMWSESEYERISGASVVCSDHEIQEREQKWHTVFGNLVTERAVARRLPSLHVSALCHAAVRWDKGRKLVANDFYDFHHAAAAVGYCEAFMTEKPLMSLLQQRHLQLVNDYPCVVIADINEAVEWMGGIYQETDC
ncbi:hypothetical protein [Shewanella mangrovisoli]|uniref:hypothetical protein n=1 Tax=Shewanella mangrovisoli TaxID=2864211 RepID=UPI0035B98CD7